MSNPSDIFLDLVGKALTKSLTQEERVLFYQMLREDPGLIPLYRRQVTVDSLVSLKTCPGGEAAATAKSPWRPALHAGIAAVFLAALAGIWLFRGEKPASASPAARPVTIRTTEPAPWKTVKKAVKTLLPPSTMAAIPAKTAIKTSNTLSRTAARANPVRLASVAPIQNQKEITMTNKLIAATLTGVALASAPVQGADKIWTGSVDTNWDTTTANWTADGAAATFAARDNVFFTDDAATKSVTARNLAVGKIVFSNDTDYVLDGGAYRSGNSISGGGLQEVPRFEKWGSGKLTINALHNFTGDVFIAEGCVQTTPNNDYWNAQVSALGNPRVPRKVIVSTNATLSFFGNGPTGAGTSPTDVKMDIEVHSGTLNLQTNFGTTFGNLLLDNANVVYAGGVNSGWRTMIFTGDWIKFYGTNVYTFTVPDAEKLNWNSSWGLSLGRSRPTEIYVDDITSNAASDVIWQLPLVRVWRGDPSDTGNYPGHFTKTGPGTLELASRLNTFTGNVRVVEGTLVCSAGHTDTNYHDDCGGLGSTRYPHSVYIGTNATLWLTSSDIQGQFYNDSQITLHVDGGTLKQNSGLANGFGALILENATLLYYNSFNYYDGFWPTFGFNGPVTFKGTNAYTLAQNGNSTLYFGSTGMVDVIVEDITRNTNTDVAINMPIVNGMTWYWGTNGIIAGTLVARRPCQFRKKGAGTLALGSVQSSFTGDVEVAEGVLQLTGAAPTYRATGPLGNPWVKGRKITVLPGAELFYAAGDVNGQLSTSNYLCTVVSNGTLRIVSGKCSCLGSLDFYDADFEYGDGQGDYWGVCGFGEKFKLNGTRPYDFTVKGSDIKYNKFSLGYETDYEMVSEALYKGKTEWEVCDITGNGAVDATFRPILQDIPAWGGRTVTIDGVTKSVCFSCGLKKTGAGTLRLTGPNTYTSETDIVEGALLIDSASSKSPVTVKSGGHIGGTGTVPSLTVEQGGGFEVFSDQTDTLNVGSLTLPEGGGVIRVCNLANTDKSALHTTFLTFNKLNGTFDPKKWRVELDGTASPSLGVRMKGNTLFVRWSPPGTVIKLM